MIITVIGLMFGDEGKGHTVAALTNKWNARAIVRFSGGSQAAHRVVHNGKAHIFAQIGSGSAVSPNVKTYLTRQMAVDPLNLAEELKVHRLNGLGDLSLRLRIDPECPVVTVYHKALNQAREIDRVEKGLGRISTTGLGVGEVMSDMSTPSIPVLRMRDLCNPISKLKEQLNELFYSKYRIIKKFKPKARHWFLSNVAIDEYCDMLIALRSLLKRCITNNFCDELDDEIKRGVVILEGSQGTLLDPDCGTKPYITRSKVTLSHASKLLDAFNYKSDRLNLGVIRSYITRHGLGPLFSESKYLTNLLPDPHNVFNTWQRNFRCGWLDFWLLRYSLYCNRGLDGVIVTNFDRLPDTCFYFDVYRNRIETSSKELITILERFLSSLGFSVYGISRSEECTVMSFMECCATCKEPMIKDIVGNYYCPDSECINAEEEYEQV